MKNYFIILLAAASVLVAGASFSAVLVVDPAGGGDFLTLEAAALEVVDGDVLEFVDGTHYIESQQVEITVTNLTLRAANGDASTCCISGSGDFNGVYFSEPSWGQGFLEFKDIEFSQCFIYAFFEEVLVRGCHFRNMENEGLYSWFNTVIENSLFENSNLRFVGGITAISSQFYSSSVGTEWEYGSDYLQMEDCNFFGSSIHGILRTMQVNQCSFEENSSIEMAINQNASVTSSIFANNQFENGLPFLVAGWAAVPEVTITDCTFRNNTSTGRTAGIGAWHGSYTSPASVICENVDFVGNSAPNGSPDAYVGDESILTLNCCEIDENNIGGDGLVNITFDGCSVATKPLRLGDLKAIYR